MLSRHLEMGDAVAWGDPSVSARADVVQYVLRQLIPAGTFCWLLACDGPNAIGCGLPTFEPSMTSPQRPTLCRVCLKEISTACASKRSCRSVVKSSCSCPSP